MDFAKMHGLGNDYVVVDGFREKLDEQALPGIARRLCDRHFGIGSDGLILVLPSRVANVRMRMFNPDGSEAEMCGNGIRCFGKFVHDREISRENPLSVETLAGVKTLKLSIEGGLVVSSRVDMGQPRLRRGEIPMSDPPRGTAGRTEQVIGEPIKVGAKRFEATCVSMGNPHCVIFVDDVDHFPVESIGPIIEHHRLFPQRTNVEFVQVLNAKEIRVRVWERGAGITPACGTGACASVVASSLNDRTDRKVTVHLPGGDLHVEWLGDGRVMMTGPAEEVFTGTIGL